LRDREIRKYVTRWLDGEISFHQFENWFVPSTWDVHKWNDPAAESLVDEIEFRISEHSDGLLTMDELKVRFAELNGVI
jgi:hypothetical protein